MVLVEPSYLLRLKIIVAAITQLSDLYQEPNYTCHILVARNKQQLRKPSGTLGGPQIKSGMSKSHHQTSYLHSNEVAVFEVWLGKIIQINESLKTFDHT